MTLAEKKSAKVREWMDAIEDARDALSTWGAYLHRAMVLGTTEEEFQAELRKLQAEGLEGWADAPMDLDKTLDLLMGREPEEPESEPMDSFEQQLMKRVFG